MCRTSSGTTVGVAPTAPLRLGPAQCSTMGGEATGEQHTVPLAPLGCVWCRTGETPAGFQWVVAELKSNGRLEIERWDNKDSSPLLSTSTLFSCTQCPFGSLS